MFSDAEARHREWFTSRRIGLHIEGLEIAQVANLVAWKISALTLEDWRPSEVLPPRLAALTELQAHSVVVTSEIIALLREGYPAGGEARWRTLHELVVTGRLLSRRGQQLSKRYHDSIFVSMRAALRAGELLGPRDSWGLEERTLARTIEDQAAAAVHEHGDKLNAKNGWASPAVRKKGRIDFRDLERVAGAARRRSAYRSASRQVHGDRHGTVTATRARDFDGFYVGGRFDGFLDPALRTIWSANELTGLLTAEVRRATGNEEPLIWDECHTQLVYEADRELRRAASTRALARGDHEEALRIVLNPELSFVAMVRDAL
jgi:hypothetical protein